MSCFNIFLLKAIIKFYETLHLQAMIQATLEFHLKSVFKGIINLATKMICNFKFSVKLPTPALTESTYSSNWGLKSKALQIFFNLLEKYYICMRDLKWRWQSCFLCMLLVFLLDSHQWDGMSGTKILQ